MDGKVPSTIALLKILLITGAIIVESFLKINIGMVFILHGFSLNELINCSTSPGVAGFGTKTSGT